MRVPGDPASRAGASRLSKAEQRLRLFQQARGLPLGVSGSADRAETEAGYAAAHTDAARRRLGAYPPPASTAPESTVREASAGPHAAPATGPFWRDLGPVEITNGQTYGSGRPGSRVNVSGRVSAIAVDPANAPHVLCGSAGGGIWESFDNGASWAPRTDYQPTLTTGAIAFDPLTPEIVYALTRSWPEAWTGHRGRIDEKAEAIQLFDPGSAFKVPDLTHLTREAIIKPPAPFSGSATYRRESPREVSWVGDLSVNLPGFGEVPLAGRAATATVCADAGCQD